MQPTVFVLTLQDAVERRQQLVDSLTQNGVEFELWFGVDGRDGLPDEHEALVDRDAARGALGREMGNAEFACALSHYFIYKNILTRGLKTAIILEDDAIVEKPFFDLVASGPKVECDILLLDHMRADVWRSSRLDLGSGSNAYRVAFSPMLTTGYLINRKAAQTLVDQSIPISAPADWPIDISAMDTFAADPRLVDHPDQETSSSYIRHERIPTSKQKQGPSRFLQIAYWKRTYKKRTSRRIS